ncbi:protein-tyrosine-phosphatase [Plakobranchus ocellatus]|uniref:Protein-tyrosine-phosphatase n=1 Tax=Plakobranchus ocellatus TaxID=259542 RepID=A0AAV3YFU2_9GAST|nr:protein-tyrosine-phosphatase [Plakobranchus ocellatus]
MLITVLMVVLALLALSNGQQLQGVQLTSTTNSITLRFAPNLAATNYTASFRITQSVFITDIPLEPPYNNSDLIVTYDNLAPGFRYTVEIYENETSSDYKVFEKEIATVPLRPEDVQVISRGNSYLYLQWVSHQNLTYETHEINYLRENGSRMTEKLSSELTFNLTELEPGYNYEIYVVAITLNARSQSSEVIVASTIPLSPTNVTARAVGSSQINVTWEADPSSFQESFGVNYSLPDAGTEQTTICTGSPCLFSPNSIAGETIRVSVYAVSHSYISKPFSLQHSTAPGKVTGLEATEGVGSLYLRWIAPVNSFQVHYHITVITVVGEVSQDFKIPASSTTYLLEPLRGGFIFKVQIQAQSEFEMGEAISEIFRTLPEPVSNLTGAAINTTSISFSWINPTNSEIDSLNITVSLRDGEVVLSIDEDDETKTSQTISELHPGKEYEVSIAVFSMYTKRSSEEVLTFIRTKPVPPTIVAVDASETSINITLIPSSDFGEFDSIQAMLDGGVVQHIADPNGLVTFPDLEHGSAYNFKTFSVSGQVLSDQITTTLYTRPRPPSDLDVVSEGERSISVTWSGPDQGGFDNFTVVLTDIDNSMNPKPGTTYNVSVMTVKGDQTSKEVWDLNTTTPLPVTHMRVSVRGIDTVTLAWDAPAGSALSGFALTFDPLNLTLIPLPVEVDQYKLEGLQPDTNYSSQVFVFSRRPRGGLVYSAATHFNFSTYPESVAALQKVEALTNSITVNWTAPTSVNIDFFHLGIKSEDPSPKPYVYTINALKNTTNTTFEGLEPGMKYTIAIRTAVYSPSRQPYFGVSVKLHAVTKPLPVQDLSVETLNTTAVALKWETNSTSRQNRFRITYTAEETSRTMTLPAGNESDTSHQRDIGQLLPGYAYSVSVIAIRSIETDLAESDEASVVGLTGRDLFSVIHNLDPL